jgi:hypothetical protein
MIDGIPIGEASIYAGWGVLAAVLLILFRQISRGNLLTKREGDAMQRRIDKQEEALALKDATIAKFTDGIELNNDLVRAFLRVAEKRPPS